MNEQRYKSERRRAERMAGRSADDKQQAEYWKAYGQGLRRAQYGDKFITPDDHAAFMALYDARDKVSKQRGQGYRDGLAFSEITGTMGRPSKFNEETVSVGVRLPKSAADKIPKPKSEWICNLILKNQK